LPILRPVLPILRIVVHRSLQRVRARPDSRLGRAGDWAAPETSYRRERSERKR
jgi:hypothetical protein